MRVQLHKKRKQKRRDSDFDDSLENAVVESPDDIDDGDTVRTALSGNRYDHDVALRLHEVTIFSFCVIYDIFRRYFLFNINFYFGQKFIHGRQLITITVHCFRIVKPPTRETERRIGVSVSTTKRSSSRSNSPIRSTKFVVRNISPKLTSLK